MPCLGREKGQIEALNGSMLNARWKLLERLLKSKSSSYKEEDVFPSHGKAKRRGSRETVYLGVKFE